ncbi:MAG: rod shape-determining protein RodA [Patescibacteria group bacterium]|nr:rod shape-determining protein RodA [Patescibacteria group bacterium]
MNLNFIGKIDKTLFFAVVILICVGLIIILSTSYSSSGIDFLNFKKQIIFSVIGIVLMFIISLFDYRALKNYTGILYILAFFILVAVLFSGLLIRGASSWFSFGFINFQPSEFVKIIVIIILAKYLSKTKDYVSDIKRLVVSGIYISLPVLLILFQPDFGSALVIMFIWFSMIFISGINRKYMISVILLGGVLFTTGWLYVFRDYQKDRILTFVNPQSDPHGAGYNVIQSIIAIGSGNIWGKGLGHGSQSQLNFLPEKHTDFIFAVIAEEMGFIGIVFVISLFGIIFYRLFKIVNESQDNFGKLIVLGSAFMLMFHFFVNTGMNMGIMPITGIPLPFISYGGSSLVGFLIVIGLVQSVYVKGRGYKIEKGEDD